jgi:predicted metal-dependent hydrolase
LWLWHAVDETELKAFFRRDFHPWDVQNQHLIDEWVTAHPS